MEKERIDKILVQKGLVETRQKAQALIMEGKVRVGGRRVEKAGTRVAVSAEVEIVGEALPYVSRGGLKLDGALRSFRIDPYGWTVIDVGASTGGFTDCVLQRGAAKVYAVDVGHGQLAWKLRNDPRVVVLEKRNIRYLQPREIGEPVDLIVIDTSFISIERFLARLVDFLKENGRVLALIKPQFEVGRREVGKGGVVKDPVLHQKVIDRIARFSESVGFAVEGLVESPLLGPRGNKEFFIYLRRRKVGFDGGTS